MNVWYGLLSIVGIWLVIRFMFGGIGNPDRFDDQPRDSYSPTYNYPPWQ